MSDATKELTREEIAAQARERFGHRAAPRAGRVLIGLAEMHMVVPCGPQTAYKWSRRNQLPEPVDEFAGTKLWDLDEFIAWYFDRPKRRTRGVDADWQGE